MIHTTEYLYKFKGIEVQINLPMQYMYSQLYSKCFRGGRNATKQPFIPAPTRLLPCPPLLPFPPLLSMECLYMLEGAFIVCNLTR